MRERRGHIEDPCASDGVEEELADGRHEESDVTDAPSKHQSDYNGHIQYQIDDVEGPPFQWPQEYCRPSTRFEPIQT